MAEPQTPDPEWVNDPEPDEIVGLGDTVDIYDGDEHVATVRAEDAGPQMDALKRVLVHVTTVSRPLCIVLDGRLMAPWATVMPELIAEQNHEATERIDRLAATVRKLAGWSGHDIADLIDEGYLHDGDL
jgi:hypothetical protein